jgi:hypothetical protein
MIEGSNKMDYILVLLKLNQCFQVKLSEHIIDNYYLCVLAQGFYLLVGLWHVVGLALMP